MDNNDKNIDFKALFLRGVRSGMVLYGIIWASAIVLAAFSLFDFSAAISAYGNVLMGFALFILGIPLSIFIRLDMLGDVLGVYNPQLLLLIGSAITCVNIALVLGGRELLLGSLRRGRSSS